MALVEHLAGMDPALVLQHAALAGAAKAAFGAAGGLAAALLLERLRHHGLAAAS